LTSDAGSEAAGSVGEPAVPHEVGGVAEPSAPTQARGAARLAEAVLAEEARLAQGPAAVEEVVLPDDLLPGVGDESMSLRSAIGVGGAGTLVALGSARLVDLFDTTALAVLAPDIQRSLDVSDAVMGAIGGAFGVLFLLGSIPISALADRYPRKIIAAVSMAAWGVIVLLTALVQNAFWLFFARIGAGISQAHSLPVNGPLLMDTYPIQARSRIFAAYGSFDVVGRAAAPLFAGGIAGLVAGPESWRWVFVATSALSIPVVILLARIREPRRGSNEMQAVFGHELAEDRAELPISLGVAFERLRKIRSFYFFLAGMAALGFALFSIPLFLNLYLEDELGLSAWERGVFGSIVVLPSIVALALVGPRADTLYRRNPAAAVAFVGALVAAFGTFVVAALYMPNLALLGVFYAIGVALSQAAFVTVVSLTSSVIP
jgi:MFS family permease